MALDIRMDDEIVVAGEVFTISGLERFPMAMNGAFADMMLETVSTRRAPDISGGKRGAAETYLRNIASTPLVPVQPRVELRTEMKTPVQTLELYLDGDTEIVHVLIERKAIYA